MRKLNVDEFMVYGYYVGNKKRYSSFTSYDLIKREEGKKYPCTKLTFSKSIKSMATLEKRLGCKLVEIDSKDYYSDLSAIGINGSMKKFTKIFTKNSL